MNLKFFSISVIIAFFIFPLICFSEQPDPKVWEYFGKDSTGGIFYCSKIKTAQSSGIIPFKIYYRVTDDERKERVEKIKNDDLKKADKYRHYDHDISVIEIDCKNKMTRVEEFTEYDDKGNSLKYDINDDMEWKSIPSNSVIEEFYKKKCLTGKKPPKKK